MSYTLNNRDITIATMHEKEQIIGPIIQQTYSQARYHIPNNFDTDQFGSFSGEKKRPSDQFHTAVLKAQAALQQQQSTIAIASEGSFNSHPIIPGVTINKELIILLDTRYGITIAGEYITTNTIAHSNSYQSRKQLVQDLAVIYDFPRHGLIMKHPYKKWPRSPKKYHITKDISTYQELELSRKHHSNYAKELIIENDCRAHRHPTRQHAIARATENLIMKLTGYCPQCSLPGWSITKTKKGMPCKQCFYPTNKSHQYIRSCNHCHHQKEETKNQLADPLHCPQCNP